MTNGAPRILRHRVRASVRACAGHPAVLCYAIGNEIPAPIVRWHGSRRVEQFLERLYLAAKDEDPEGLVTYVNYPTTEYLQLPFLDLRVFQCLPGDARAPGGLSGAASKPGRRPAAVMGEIGLDSRRNGEPEQAQVLDWQIRTTLPRAVPGRLFLPGPMNGTVAAMTLTDWDFGLTDRQRHPKPALAAVSRAFAEVPFPADSLATYFGGGLQL